MTEQALFGMTFRRSERPKGKRPGGGTLYAAAVRDLGCAFW